MTSPEEPRPTPPEDPFPEWVTPLDPVILEGEILNPNEWIVQPKLDGVRLFAYVQKGLPPKFYTEQKKRVRYGALPILDLGMEQLGHGHSFVLDGEFIYGEGKTDEERSRASGKIASNPRPLVTARIEEERKFKYHVFDLLYRDGRNLTGVPLEERLRELSQMIPWQRRELFGIRIVPHETRGIKRKVEAWREEGYEGVVYKRKGSLYRKTAGFQLPWRKVRFANAA